jgi:carbamoyltransferase
VLLNTEIKKRFNRRVYVAPNSNDCGISAGSILYYLKPEKPVNLMYSGLPPLDENAFFHYFYRESTKLKIIPISELPSKLNQGKIIGVIRGGSEHGPRALGNRSILCNPAIPNMKDILNSKVKNREWYRPFAPVVKMEDADKYFDVLEESPYMSFAFNVRSEWREKLESITHVDGTARVQTLRKEHNPWLYDLISEFEKISGHGVLLNTSFNVNGMPILSTVREAFQVLTSTQMDGIVVQNTLVIKNE